MKRLTLMISAKNKQEILGLLKTINLSDEISAGLTDNKTHCVVATEPDTRWILSKS